MSDYLIANTETSITLAGDGGVEILRFCPDGKVFVRGELVDDNRKVYDEFMAWLSSRVHVDAVFAERDRLKERLDRILGARVGPSGVNITNGVPIEMVVDIESEQVLAEDCCAAVREQEVKPLARELLLVRLREWYGGDNWIADGHPRFASGILDGGVGKRAERIEHLANLAGGWWVSPTEFKEEP